MTCICLRRRYGNEPHRTVALWRHCMCMMSFDLGTRYLSTCCRGMRKDIYTIRYFYHKIEIIRFSLHGCSPWTAWPWICSTAASQSRELLAYWHTVLPHKIIIFGNTTARTSGFTLCRIFDKMLDNRCPYCIIAWSSSGHIVQCHCSCVKLLAIVLFQVPPFSVHTSNRINPHWLQNKLNINIIT